MTLWNLMTDPPLDFQLRVLKADIQQRIAITDKNKKPTYVNQIMKFKPEKVKLQENLGCLPRSAMFNVVSSMTLISMCSGTRALMTAYCTSSDTVRGMICLSAWNSPPKYSFNHWVVTVNVPFSGCVTSAPTM